VTRTLALDGGLHLELAVLDQLLQLLGQLGLDAVLDLDDLLDLVAAHLLGLLDVQEAHVHIALGQLVAQQVFHLLQLELGIAEHGDFLVLQLDGGRCAFEVKAGADLLGGVVTAFLTSTKSASKRCQKKAWSLFP
jgi:hypothetical protein